jgi:1,2-diacylglycerol 3-beta-glucosyltransferase
MDIIIYFLQLLILLPIGFFLLYLAALTLLSFMAKINVVSDDGEKKMFAVMIPAHNEELTIGRTLQSASALNYPKNRYDVIVVADNCTDGTASISKSLNAKVYERFNNDLRGKGYALRWIFDRIASENNYDAAVIVDADSILDGEFLNVMNSCIKKGAASIQGKDIVEEGPVSWSSAMIKISFLLYNYVRPMGRKVVGLPTGLRGNGMCLSVDTIRSVPWEAYTLAEDVEYGLNLLLKNKSTVFAPDAVVFAKMPMEAKNAQSQRTRWETGRFLLIKKYLPSLMKEAWRKKSYIYIDAVIDLITPSVVNMMFIVAVMIFFNAAVLFVGMAISYSYLLLWLIAGFFGLFHLFAGLYAAKAEKNLYLALLQIPRYIFWKIGLYMRIIRKNRQDEWIRTAREK